MESSGGRLLPRLQCADLMVLLLHAPGNRGQEAIRGMTRLQKLLFVIEQKVGLGRISTPTTTAFDAAVHDARTPFARFPQDRRS